MRLFLLFFIIGAVIFLFFRELTSYQIKTLTVISGSMTPSLPIGNVVFVISQSTYYVDDIITYTLGDHFITHRIVYAGDYYLTKGDANESIDSASISRDQIVGRVLFSMPGHMLLASIICISVLIIGHEIYIIYCRLK